MSRVPSQEWMPSAPGDGLVHGAGGELLGEGGVFVALCAFVEQVGDSGDDIDGRRDVGANVSCTNARRAF